MPGLRPAVVVQQHLVAIHEHVALAHKETFCFMARRGSGVANGVGARPRFDVWRREAGSFAALQQVRHLAGQGTHGLETLFVAADLVWGQAVGGVPILRGDDGHPYDGEELVETVEGGARPAAAGLPAKGASKPTNLRASERPSFQTSKLPSFQKKPRP